MTADVWNELVLKVPEWFGRPTPRITPDGGAAARPERPRRQIDTVSFVPPCH